MDNNFKVGDRIKIKSTCKESGIIGFIGVIILIGDSFLVEFEKSLPQFHSGGGKGKDEHCYWVTDYSVELVEAKKPEYIVGRWYKTGYGNYVKFLEFKDDIFSYSEYIKLSTKEVKVKDGWFSMCDNTVTLVPDSEVEPYLPKKEEKVDNKPVIGGYVRITKNGRHNNIEYLRGEVWQITSVYSASLDIKTDMGITRVYYTGNDIECEYIGLVKPNENIKDWQPKIGDWVIITQKVGDEGKCFKIVAPGDAKGYWSLYGTIYKYTEHQMRLALPSEIPGNQSFRVKAVEETPITPVIGKYYIGISNHNEDIIYIFRLDEKVADLLISKLFKSSSNSTVYTHRGALHKIIREANQSEIEQLTGIKQIETGLKSSSNGNVPTFQVKDELYDWKTQWKPDDLVVKSDYPYSKVSTHVMGIDPYESKDISFGTKKQEKKKVDLFNNNYGKGIFNEKLNLTKTLINKKQKLNLV